MSILKVYNTLKYSVEYKFNNNVSYFDTTKNA